MSADICAATVFCGHSQRRWALQAQAGRGVVGPGLLHAHVAAQGRERPVPGLAGDRPVTRSAQVRVGDEAGSSPPCSPRWPRPPRPGAPGQVSMAAGSRQPLIATSVTGATSCNQLRDSYPLLTAAAVQPGRRTAPHSHHRAEHRLAPHPRADRLHPPQPQDVRLASHGTTYRRRYRPPTQDVEHAGPEGIPEALSRVIRLVSAR